MKYLNSIISISFLIFFLIVLYNELSIDSTSMIIIISVNIVFISSVGCFKDVIEGFKLLYYKKNISKQRMRQVYQIFHALINVTVIAGVIGSLLITSVKYRYISHSESFLSFNEIQYMPLICSLVIAICIYYPIKIKMRLMLNNDKNGLGQTTSMD